MTAPRPTNGCNYSFLVNCLPHPDEIRLLDFLFLLFFLLDDVVVIMCFLQKKDGFSNLVCLSITPAILNILKRSTWKSCLFPVNVIKASMCKQQTTNKQQQQRRPNPKQTNTTHKRLSRTVDQHKVATVTTVVTTTQQTRGGGGDGSCYQKAIRYQ